MNDLDIKDIRKKLNISQEKLAEILGVHRNTVQNWETGAKIPKSKYTILCRLIEPLKQSPQQSNVNGNNINGNNVTVNQPDTMDKMMELLAKKEDSLKKAQEHIDKLLEIISNITTNQNK